MHEGPLSVLPKTVGADNIPDGEMTWDDDTGGKCSIVMHDANWALKTEKYHLPYAVAFLHSSVRSVIAGAEDEGIAVPKQIKDSLQSEFRPWPQDGPI